jgi:hypothetical protein
MELGELVWASLYSLAGENIGKRICFEAALSAFI